MSRVYLVLAGIIALAIGTMILLAPVAFYASYGIAVAGQVNLLSELRSHGLGLIGGGLFIASGAFVIRLAPVAIIVATALYLSYGISRVVGMAMDGLPASGLVVVAAIEIVIGLIGLGLLLGERRSVRA